MEEVVKEYMKSNVISVEKSLTLKEVTEIMTKNNVGSVIVVDNGKPVGII
ncbi:MAG: CBS domain-containing protein, partial [Acidianus infernus]|nr:CBS domain-containing protein [Acidianus infernus]